MEVNLDSFFSDYFHCIATLLLLHPFNGPWSGTTRMNRYQKGKTNLDFTEARDSEWQWHQLGHVQVCTSLQTDNNSSTPQLKFFYRPDALPAAQPTASKHWRHCYTTLWNLTQMFSALCFPAGWAPTRWEWETIDLPKQTVPDFIPLPKWEV